MESDYTYVKETINNTGRFILVIGALMLGKIYGEHHPNDSVVQGLNKYNPMIPKKKRILLKRINL